MGQVIYSARARADIGDIWLSVATDGGIALADTKVDKILRRAEMLVLHPQIGPARPELAEDARSLLVDAG